MDEREFLVVGLRLDRDAPPGTGHASEPRSTRSPTENSEREQPTRRPLHFCISCGLTSVVSRTPCQHHHHPINRSIDRSINRAHLSPAFTTQRTGKARPSTGSIAPASRTLRTRSSSKRPERNTHTPWPPTRAPTTAATTRRRPTRSRSRAASPRVRACVDLGVVSDWTGSGWVLEGLPGLAFSDGKGGRKPCDVSRKAQQQQQSSLHGPNAMLTADSRTQPTQQTRRSSSSGSRPGSPS